MSLSSSGGRQTAKGVAGMSSLSVTSAHNQGSSRLTSAKRPRSPTEGTCGRCFCSSHKAAKCRHQAVCLRCVGVGHMAAHCSVECSPHRKRLHVRSKHVTSSDQQVGPRDDSVRSRRVSMDEQPCATRVKAVPEVVTSSSPRPICVDLSLSLTLKISELREKPAKVVVLTLMEGFVNKASIVEVAPSIINKPLAGPITPLNEIALLFLLASREDVKEVCKIGSFKVVTKDGPYTMKISPWSAEIRADDRASGEGQWIHIWNLPLNGWCWSIIFELVWPVGELIAFSQAPLLHKRFM